MQSRNYMVRLYQRMLKASTDGQAYLTGTECRRKLAGDVCSILRCVQESRYVGEDGDERACAFAALVKTPFWGWVMVSFRRFRELVQCPRVDASPLRVPLAVCCNCFISRRIHDFLDRFGLVNTRTGGKRPPSYPVPPPSTHLWSPTPPSDPVPRAPKSAGGDAKEKGEGGGRVAARGSAAEGGVGGGGWSRAVGGAAQQPSGYSGSRDREWHRHELVRLMESAVANPDRWEIVAQQV